MSLWLYLGGILGKAWLAGNLLEQIVSTFSLISSAALLYILVLSSLGMPELNDAITKIRNRFRPQA
jgi:hypothetical protein